MLKWLFIQPHLVNQIIRIRKERATRKERKKVRSETEREKESKNKEWKKRVRIERRKECFKKRESKKREWEESTEKRKIKKEKMLNVEVRYWFSKINKVRSYKSER